MIPSADTGLELQRAILSLRRSKRFFHRNHHLCGIIAACRIAEKRVLSLDKHFVVSHSMSFIDPVQRADLNSEPPDEG